MIPFVHPLFVLAGAGLTVLPIVLHLLMRQRPRRFEFPALRFVERRHDANRRRLRLRHVLLLALRVAIILLLAFALARPIAKLPGALGRQEAPVAAALVFDTSVRMEYRHENRSRLEVARELGQWLLAQLPEGSRVAVLDSRPGPAAFQVDRGAAKHRIERLETVANAQSLTGALDEALRLLGPSELEKLFKTIRKLKAQGKTIIYISHRIAEIFDIADRVTVLKDGKIVGTYDIDGRIDRHFLISRMAGLG